MQHKASMLLQNTLSFTEETICKMQIQAQRLMKEQIICFGSFFHKEQEVYHDFRLLPFAEVSYNFQFWIKSTNNNISPSSASALYPRLFKIRKCRVRSAVYRAGNCMFKVNNKNFRKNAWNTFKVSNKDNKQRHWRRFDVFNVNFEHISHLCSSVSIVNFQQVNAGLVTKNYDINIS